MRCDFNGAWEGVVSRGPNKGTHIVCNASNVTAEKWASVSKVHSYTVAFDNASYEDTKTVAFRFLELHMHASEAKVQGVRASAVAEGMVLLAAPVGVVVAAVDRATAAAPLMDIDIARGCVLGK